MSLSPTRAQLNLLRFITGYQHAHDGISPRLDDCRLALGQSGKGGVYRLLAGLEERGLIHRLPGRARAIQVLVPVQVPTAPDGAPLFAVPIRALQGRAH